jgi:hypothetical protein
MSDLGSFCSANSFDDDCDTLNGQNGATRSNGKGLSGRDLTSGDSNKSPTFSGGNHIDVKNNNKKSMDDVLKKLSSKFGPNFEGATGLNSSATFTIGNA